MLTCMTRFFLSELDALGDDFEEEEGIPSYLREDATTELPDFVDEPPVTEQVSGHPRDQPSLLSDSALFCFAAERTSR